jgi:hypothetical protein
MSAQSYLPLPGLSDNREVWALSQWLPQRGQIISAVQLRIDEVVGHMGDESENEADVRTTSMRQGLGLVVLAGLVAGALPFLVNLIIGIRAGTALPLVRLAGALSERSASGAGPGGGDPLSAALPLDVWAETARTIAGLDPLLPGWIAALLSALGEWVNWPLNWLTFWLVYGLGVLLVAKLFGAPTTVQRFYAATSYAFVPLVLTGLAPIPCVGGLASVVALFWMFALYVHAVQVVTDVGIPKAVISVLLPAAGGLLLSLILAGSIFVSLFSLLW